MWDEQTIKKILERVRTGHAEPEEAFQELTDSVHSFDVIRTLDEAMVDLDRARRCGYSEVIYSEGKSNGTLLETFQALIDHDQDALATRVSPTQAEVLTKNFPKSIYHAQARTVRYNRHDLQRQAKVAIIAAGTTDLPVACEAVETLRWMHIPTDLITDVGVAGPQRLPSQLDRFCDSDAIVVVAGMEGALPSVVGGYVKCPIIAVPTSVGYGANFGGVTALLAMMNSCAASVTVVNIDGGFKGGYVAGMIAGRMADLREANA
jgi:pyridinium-3,5-biscarboxylic acid mononucleotide synthase